MKIIHNKNHLRIVRWIARISAGMIFLFVTPFYVGYGFPMPNATLSWLENLWLIIIPFFLIGLLLGWKWERVGGFMISIPVLSGFIAALFIREDPSWVMAVPLIPGVLYLISAYSPVK